MKLGTILTASLVLVGLAGIDEPPSELKRNEGIENVLHNIYTHSSNSDTRYMFNVGDSNYTISERNRMVEVQKLQERGQSYTNYGEAKVIGSSKESCVAYAKRITGINRPIGWGGRAGINSQTPKVGAIGSEVGIYHAVVVVAINEDMITIHEANYYRGKITERTLPRSRFLGFII